ncbi:MAG TPA: acyl-CoA dehydrogenase [Aeromicrobium sp.]|nr:acyl-CoA dehydrogenase [Aeromicrobium sp.]
MPIAITDDHRALFESMRDAARAADGAAGQRRDAPQTTAIAVPEALGGDGGEVADLAVALEGCAHALLPGPGLGTAIAATLLGQAGESSALTALLSGARAGVALTPMEGRDDRLQGSAVVPGTDLDWMLLGAGDKWFAVPVDQIVVKSGEGLDLSRGASRVSVDLPVASLEPLAGVTSAAVRRVAVALAAAEASGIAEWCLETAVEYAKVREQFGQPIGRFQAIKHLCAGMLESTEGIAAVAWDAASTALGPGDQGDLAAEVAGAFALDAAVRVAQDCIQVLGGIGFTFEHDAHRYLRRSIALRSWLGGAGASARRLASHAVDGRRRQLAVDLGGQDELVRESIRTTVAEIASKPEAERRSALVDAGYLMPHWPKPYGLGASPVEQIVIDEELARARIDRPDIKIAAWAVPTILGHGTDAQRERFVRPSLLGDLTWCQLFSEPGAGSDLASLATRAERVDDGWTLTGQKVWTSLAAESDWAVCLARTNPAEKRHKGISYFLVDMTSPGIDIRPLREMTGDALFNEVFLDSVFVPDDCVVGDIDDGWRLARTTLSNERVAMASAKLDASVERAIELVAASDEPSDLVRVGHAIALSTACSLLGARAALRSIGGGAAAWGPGAESSVAKLLGVRNRQEASELVVDLLGERALSDHDDVRADIHEMLLTRCLSIAGGTTQILRNVAAESILGLPR